MNAKPWYASKTYWREIVGGVLMLLATFGIDLPEGMLEKIVGTLAALGMVAGMLIRNRTSSPIQGSTGDPNSPGGQMNSPSVITLLAVLLTIGLLGGISGCTVSDLKPSSAESRSFDGTKDAALMALLIDRWYVEICSPATRSQQDRNDCYNTKEAHLDNLEVAKPLMEVRDRRAVKSQLKDAAPAILAAGTDTEDKQLKGWLP